jgi:hypothetical protein
MTHTGEHAPPDLAAPFDAPGTPAAIQATAILLREQVGAYATSADQYADNVLIAMDAMGFGVPDGMIPMIRQTVIKAWRDAETPSPAA